MPTDTKSVKVKKLSQWPIAGRFGPYGGRYAPEILMPALLALEAAYQAAQADEGFRAELRRYQEDYGGRPTPLYRAKRLSELAGGARIYLKREDLVHGGAHKFNNVMGQALLAQRMGKSRLIAETGAGQHGVATAMAGAVLGLKTEIYMGQVDIERQRANVYRMELLGAQVHPVHTGTATLKDAINEALRDWATSVQDSHYLIGSVVGPHPYPQIVRDFQRVIGDEIEGQMLRKEHRLPDLLVACVGGGSNAMGTFFPFVDHREVRFLGVEAGGRGPDADAASLQHGQIGVLHGAKMRLLQDEWGQVSATHSIAAGLDYPGVGPEHTLYQEIGRAEYVTVSDEQALSAFQTLSQTCGIIPALESAHAVYAGMERARTMGPGQLVVITLSGRGDKDLETVIAHLGRQRSAGGQEQ
ncbi:MAG TPA: tryptophan synthase subunit beta [Candidatus Fraserbacteria bacterium]|nr:tryptophan synthase subunit beta [Candidatus Fraserbacteria bacterium]